MRYIPKPQGSLARCMLDLAKAEMRDAGISELYEHFHDKRVLNDILRKEQKGICCYCQQKIDHYQEPNLCGSHNEHLHPENGPYAREDLQLDYENIYACCNYSKGFERRLQHCGEHKTYQVINRNFLNGHDCSHYFKYNSNGEILPQCPMESYKEICENVDRLTDTQKDALQIIAVLNLNVQSLVNRRKGIIDEVFKFVQTVTPEQISHKILTISSEQEQYLEFVDMILFYLKKFAKKD